MFVAGHGNNHFESNLSVPDEFGGELLEFVLLFAGVLLQSGILLQNT